MQITSRFLNYIRKPKANEIIITIFVKASASDREGQGMRDMHHLGCSIIMAGENTGHIGNRENIILNGYVMQGMECFY